MSNRSKEGMVETEHKHQHSIACGHTKIKHEDHIDYLHNGELHHEKNGSWEKCKIPVTDKNPAESKQLPCGCKHTEECGHEMVPHGDHKDYLVNGRLHHVKDGKCYDHGPVEVVAFN